MKSLILQNQGDDDDYNFKEDEEADAKMIRQILSQPKRKK